MAVISQESIICTNYQRMKLIIELFESFDFILENRSGSLCTFKKDHTSIIVSPKEIIIDDSFRILKVPYNEVNVISAIAYSLTPTLFHEALHIHERDFLNKVLSRNSEGPIEEQYADKALEVFIKYRLIIQNSNK